VVNDKNLEMVAGVAVTSNELMTNVPRSIRHNSLVIPEKMTLKLAIEQSEVE
jgi:hypothetical protein